MSSSKILDGYTQIICALIDGGGTRKELAHNTGLHYNTVCHYINLLASHGLIEEAYKPGLKKYWVWRK
jgi:DNA-binding IclR family transcriptional regulator